MKITGKIHRKSAIEQVSTTFKKRHFVLEYCDNPLYPQFINFQLSQDNCKKIDAVKKGDTVEVSFNLRGREWIDGEGTIKYFNTLDAWKVEKVALQE